MTENNPFARAVPAASFTLTSASVTDGQPFAPAQYSGMFGVPGGEDVSPQLSWSGAPEGTKSFAVTVFDADAPTQSGFWHWAVMNIPATVSELPAGASAAGLPTEAVQLPNDARAPQFIGAVPPAGHGTHRYFITVHALAVEALELPAESTPAFFEFNAAAHLLGRATIVATAEIAGA